MNIGGDMTQENKTRARKRKKSRRKAKMAAKRRFVQELDVPSYNKDLFKL
jgi:hypothetical protein